MKHVVTAKIELNEKDAVLGSDEITQELRNKLQNAFEGYNVESVTLQEVIKE